MHPRNWKNKSEPLLSPPSYQVCARMAKVNLQSANKNLKSENYNAGRTFKTAFSESEAENCICSLFEDDVTVFAI